MDPIYDRIGRSYRQTRVCDPLILARLIEYLELKPGHLILDVGAGTGNYANGLTGEGFKVIAVEPSRVMQEQKIAHTDISWLQNYAEEIELPAETIDGAVCILSTHHFTSLDKAFSEINRILRPDGRLIIFTSDPRLLPHDCWLLRYFEAIIRKEYDTRPSVNTLKLILNRIFGSEPKVDLFPIPFDLTDGFFFSAWREPERYLDTNFRNGISLFAKTDASVVNTSVDRLRNDLNNGTWDMLFSEVRNMTEYDGGYFFACVRKEQPPARKR